MSEHDTTQAVTITALAVESVLRFARGLRDQEPDWVTFYREVFGIGGAIDRMFSTRAELDAFERTGEYRQLQRMLAELRAVKQSITSSESTEELEPTRVVTVRLPKSLHLVLANEAHERRTSMNKLCIAKLLQAIAAELVPTDVGAINASRLASERNRKLAEKTDAENS